MPLAIYSLLRLAIFIVTVGVLYLVGMGGWLVVLVAAIIAAAVSYLALAKQRDAAAVFLEHRAARRTRRPSTADADAAAEDDAS